MLRDTNGRPGSSWGVDPSTAGSFASCGSGACPEDSGTQQHAGAPKSSTEQRVRQHIEASAEAAAAGSTTEGDKQPYQHHCMSVV